MAYNPVSGNALYVKLGTVSYAFAEWTYTVDGGTKKFFAAGSPSQKTLPGGYSAVVTCKGTYDQGNMPLTVGSVYALHLGVDGVIEYDLSARLSSVEYHNAVEAGGTGMGCTVTFDSDGDFSLSSV